MPRNDNSPAVPGLIPALDGLNAILFHVEHSGDVPWHYRWRIVGDYPASYLVWREKTTSARYVKISSEIRDCQIEVQWRASPEDEWGQVALLALDYARAEFQITAEVDFVSPLEGFTVTAPIRSDGVAAYRFPRLSIAAGDSAIVLAHADAPAWANVLLDAGEFQPRIKGITITNLDPSTHAWQPLPAASIARLSRCPLGSGRRWFAVGRHSVDPSLLKS